MGGTKHATLDSYVTTLNALGPSMCDKLSKVRELDSRGEELLWLLPERFFEHYTAVVAAGNGGQGAGKGPRSSGVEERARRAAEAVEEIFEQTETTAEERAKEAWAAYDELDAKIKLLDKDIRAMQKKILTQQEALGIDPVPQTPRTGSTGPRQSARTRGRPPGSTQGAGASALAGSPTGLAAAAILEAQIPVDMPAVEAVVAEGPPYCLCNRASYGDMVCCDNDDCPIEWYHFGCVGLTEEPQGTWVCPQCTEAAKNKRQRTSLART
ncbi:unnamed protein product [Pedinophyceae sp. YPF-701]|nr:unnamed protein product [Pedinophyceae sp. YPF-701]